MCGCWLTATKKRIHSVFAAVAAASEAQQALKQTLNLLLATGGWQQLLIVAAKPFFVDDCGNPSERIKFNCKFMRLVVVAGCWLCECHSAMRSSAHLLSAATCEN